MYRTEIHRHVPTALRHAVDQLIHCSWSFEASASGDVEMLVPAGAGVADPIDLASHHTLVWDHCGKLVGYGRVAIIQNAKSEPSGATIELNLPSYLNCKPEDGVIAYISRLVVHPDHRGRGISSMIHRSRIETAAKLGAKTVYGWAVGEKPRNALNHAGFVEVIERQGFSTSWYRTDRMTRLVKLDLPQNVTAKDIHWQEASNN